MIEDIPEDDGSQAAISDTEEVGVGNANSVFTLPYYYSF